jgi:hypothetical protein
MLKKDFDSNDCDEVILYRGMFDFKLRWMLHIINKVNH